MPIHYPKHNPLFNYEFTTTSFWRHWLSQNSIFMSCKLWVASNLAYFLDQNEKNLRLSHLKVHGTGEIVQCEECEEAFITEKELRQHRKIHIYCKPCGKTFHTKQSLRRHNAFKHQVKENLKLRHCEKATKFEKRSPSYFDVYLVNQLICQTRREIFSNFCGLFRKAELYPMVS